MTVNTAPLFPCPVCREELPEKGNKRRRIPNRGGRRMLVHAACAEFVDAQVTLAAPDGSPLGGRA